MNINKFAAGAVFFSQLFLITVIGAPMISVDSSDFDAGVMFQGDVKKVEHTFIVKNTGDSTLKISRVKPSCGCTTVGYDSIIAPGKSGKVIQSIDLKNIHTGPFKKNMTIYSDAKNTPEFVVALGGTLKSYVTLSKESLQLVSADQKPFADSLTLSTEKADLAITSISFKLYSSNEGTPSWQADLEIFPEFKLTKIESSDKKLSVYKLIVRHPVKEKEPKFGDFTIKTNHPKVPEIKVPGAIGN
jgi:hypothetical protein